MTDKEYLNLALAKMHNGQWFGFKKEYTGAERMAYENIIVHDSSITKPTEAEVNAKIQELKDAETANKNTRTSAINKLKGATYSALTDAEAKALFGE
jgi:hypothetical protein